MKRQQPALLPIDPSRYEKILVVGDNATRRLTEGGGSSELKVKHEISPLQGLVELYGDKITYTQGYAAGRPRYGKVEQPRVDTDSLYRKALELAADADLVIFVGGLNKNHEQDVRPATGYSTACLSGRTGLSPNWRPLIPIWYWCLSAAMPWR